MGIHRAWLRRVLGAIAAIALGVGAAAVTYQVSVEPGASAVKDVFEAQALVKPPGDFAALRATVGDKRRVVVPVDASPAAHLDLYRPRVAASNLPMILWVHGGGFISSSSATVDDYAIMLASSGYVVASLDYTLAPGARHPVPVRQASAALRYLASHAEELGGDRGRIALGGDSAGAQIASETAAAETNPALARADGVPRTIGKSLRAVILFCGLYDLKTVGDSGFPALRTYLWAYTGHRDWLSYPAVDSLSTTEQATTAYPPTFISVGDKDPFRFQARELAAALRKQSVPVTTLFWTGTGASLGHEYQFDFDLPDAATAFDKTIAFMKGEFR
ncbi:MAG TPA: alpha/beta hydrolase [Galbitalea sp.]|jgi:acetyl esterase/lipase